MNKPSIRDADITKYIEIYKGIYGVVIDREAAEFQLEALVEFVEMVLIESPLVVAGENEDVKYGPNIEIIE